MDTWVKKAYDNWNQVVEYDGKSLLNFKQMKKSSTLTSDLPLSPVDFPNTFDNQLSQQRLPASVPSQTSDQNLLSGGKILCFFCYITPSVPFKEPPLFLAR